ncbi:MAG: transcription-repair coupling factor [Candidatus Eisenbacteria bacterium]|nr:transcription-repair coupling factor [Candidatus Eisenbacteria bacterium]
MSRLGERFISRLRDCDAAGEVVRALRTEAKPRITVSGLTGSSRALFAALVKTDTQRPVVVVLPDERPAEDRKEDLEFFLSTEPSSGEVVFFPQEDVPPYRESRTLSSVSDARMSALDSLSRKPPGVLITTVRALMEKVPSRKLFSSFSLPVKRGQEVHLQDLARRLVLMGFAPQPTVTQVGEMSMRGGIVDVFSFGSGSPWRIELDGDTVSSIRLFDPDTQRSISEEKEARILPLYELVLSEEILGRLEQTSQEDSVSRVSPETELFLRIHDGISLASLLSSRGFLMQDLTSVLEYLPRDSVIFFEDEKKVLDKATYFEKEVLQAWQEIPKKDTPLSSPHELYLTGDELKRRVHDFAGVSVAGVVEAREEGSTKFEIISREPDSIGRDIRLLHRYLDELCSYGTESYILCDNASQQERLRELVGDRNVTIEVGRLNFGFIMPDIKLAVLTDRELFSRYRWKRFRRRLSLGITVRDISALRLGDYVVHDEYGIGIYRGLKRLSVDGHETDCLQMDYAGGDKLFIPVDQLNLIQKYESEEGHVPSIHRIGGTLWKRTKVRAKKAIKDMAKELLEIQAARRALSGHSFSPDTVWQKELESSFKYEETPDQLRACEDVKGDMEKSSPMERLVCGDVGYGKTEVAVRGSFKALMDGKQVAILVPTTVLAQQHYNTFSERLADYPARIEMLSRFKNKAEQKKVVQGLKAGVVDVVIGTHRLLQRDVEFRDLGLLVIDEEQRFGVAHKEALRKRKKLVDVLTMTATPIPRTLHMSLVGARDMSLVNTPPRDRIPIKTEIVEFNEELIREALLREPDRGGQSFFVHNRIYSIDSMACFLKALVPELTFAVAHGQMRERDLEEVMLRFINKEFDVLVCTMIIESGIDMPNVNTMIVNRADCFGLAQLYQLRGRVGRSKEQAYAYLLVPPGKALTEAAEKRLRVIEECDELGAGFKIAMRDLEIRGAGNILGPEQHGFILSIGFDLYCRLLEEASRELKGEVTVEDKLARLKAETSAYIPEDYVEDDVERMSLYRRLADTRSVEAVDGIEQEMVDRFGKAPFPALSLLDIRRIRLLSKGLPLESISVGRTHSQFILSRRLSKKEATCLVRSLKFQIGFAVGHAMQIKLEHGGAHAFQRTKNLLKALHSCVSVR